MNTVLNAIKQFACHTPDVIAVEGDNLSLSYRALLSEVERLSRYFQSRNLRCLALLMDNSPAWVVFDLAAQMANVTLVPLPAFFSHEQLRHSLTDAGAEVLITAQTTLAAEMLPESKPHPMQKVAGQSCWQVTLPNTIANRRPDDLNHENPHNIAKITYTSGTTGRPKGVCLMQATMDNVAHSLYQAIEITATERHLCLLPLAVLLENIGGIYALLLAGARCIVPHLQKVGMLGATRLDSQQMVNTIRTANATSIILLPQMLQALVTELQDNKTRTTASLPQQLRFIAVGGAPISSRLLDEAQILGLPLYEGYGLSECASVVAVNTPAHHRHGSVGKILSHTEIKFSDDGEILLAGNLFSGYLNHAAHNDKWYASGDLGYLSSDGYLYLSGRKKSCFITSFGRNVAPEWVEKELTLHSAIAQAVVFGEARPYNVAIIVAHSDEVQNTTTDNTVTNKEQINSAIEEANRQLPDYAQVSRWLFADEPFSTTNQQFTATGRPRRKAIWSHYGERINQLYRQDQHQTQTIPIRSHHAIF